MTTRSSTTRNRIQVAARRLFVEKGVAETSVRHIAQAVGLSEGALYRHFSSKDDLVWHLFERHYVEFAGELARLADVEAGTRAKLDAMIRGFCRAHDEDPTLFRFLLFVQHGQLDKLAAEAPTPVEAVRGVLAGGIAAGELPSQDADLATALTFGIVLQPAQFAAYGRLPGRMLPLARRLSAAVWAALTTS